ncbi:MAG TPA: hypothetical protein VK054_01045, partial [Beutenbergiaceae bacterium]|nr:hypothetical protein [Beutenbergiaceae bacterium]
MCAISGTLGLRRLRAGTRSPCHQGRGRAATPGSLEIQQVVQIGVPHTGGEQQIRHHGPGLR